jgi:hypothetical protein
VLSPATRTLDLPDAEPCALARSQGTLLIAVAESDRSPAANAERLRLARACGNVLYDDPIGVVAAP